MKNKTLLKECKCVHCQQKLEQINSSKLYWNKLILSKNLTFHQKTDLYYRVQRLIDGQQMGELFKVMFVTNRQNNFSMGF